MNELETLIGNMFYKTTVILRIFNEIKSEDDLDKYEDIVATSDNIRKYSDLSIMCIVADDKDKIIIELA